VGLYSSKQFSKEWALPEQHQPAPSQSLLCCTPADDSRRHTVKIADLASSASGLARIWFHEGQSQANINKCVKSCKLSTALKTVIIEARAAKTPLNDVS
jgi:hypothetical protein